jgi:hypothetical protein
MQEHKYEVMKHNMSARKWTWTLAPRDPKHLVAGRLENAYPKWTKHPDTSLDQPEWGSTPNSCRNTPSSVSC